MLNFPCRDRKNFFKYYTAESSILTLENNTRKWSTPLLFNDPFDNHFDLYFEDLSEELAYELAIRYIKIVTSSELLDEDQLNALAPDVSQMRSMCMNNPALININELKSCLPNNMLRKMRNAVDKIPRVNTDVRKQMADTLIFCVSESCDNILMWSHYAKNHTGAVIEFLSLHEEDSPLRAAQPVHYSKILPRVKFADIFIFDTIHTEAHKIITLTKSEAWEYEKEWRVISTLRDKMQSYQLLPFAPEEVGAVYLGCRICKTHKEKIIQITREKYPSAKIFQAEKHQTEFALNFCEVM